MTDHDNINKEGDELTCGYIYIYVCVSKHKEPKGVKSYQPCHLISYEIFFFDHLLSSSALCTNCFSSRVENWQFCQFNSNQIGSHLLFRLTFGDCSTKSTRKKTQLKIEQVLR